MRWRHRTRPTVRRPATCADPVGVAVAEATAAGPLTGRVADEPAPAAADLPGWVEVRDSDDVDGFDTRVWLDDEVRSYCDAYDDGLDQELADQPGIEAVLAEDREVVYLRTRLALEDVRAAVVRAVVAVNRNPRPSAPSAVLAVETVDGLAARVAPALARAGFARCASGPRYVYRQGDDGFVQSVAFAAGSGTSGDGTCYDGLVWVMSGTHVPGFGRDVPSAPDRVAPVHCAPLTYHWVRPDPDALEGVLVGQVLPALDATRGRAALADFVAADPTRVRAPVDRARHARLFAEWGLLAQAARLVADLDTGSRSLRSHPDVVAARALIRGS